MLEIHDVLPVAEVLDADQPTDLSALIEHSTALTLTDRTEVAMVALETELKGKIFDVTTTAGDKEARATRLKLVRLRTGLDKLRKDQNAEHKRIIDGNNDFAKRLTERIEALEQPIDAAIKVEEERKAAEKAERERVERERILAITARIELIRNTPLACISLTADQIEAEIDNLESHEITSDEFSEYTGEALQAVTKSLESMRQIQASKIAAEQEAERQRQEAERLKAEREAQEAAERQRRIEEDARLQAEREEAERKAAVAKAQADALAQAAAEQIAKAQALLDEARRVQEENDRRERDRLQREADEQAIQRADTVSKPDPIPASDPGLVMVERADLPPAEEVAAWVAADTSELLPHAEVLDAVFGDEDERPTDDSIIQAVANTFEVDEVTALRWICDVAANAELVTKMRQAA